MEAREVIDKLSIFSGAEPADLDAIARITVPKAYAPDETIFDASRPADGLIVILMGTAEIVGERVDIPIVTIGSGQMMGQVRFFEREGHGAVARTREPTRTLHIPFAALDKLLEERKGLALAFYRNAAKFFACHLWNMASERDRPYF
jgi:signal-transduction protein with cAMP-binding, CBS, and nucleotidyltransferase domain